VLLLAKLSKFLNLKKKKQEWFTHMFVDHVLHIMSWKENVRIWVEFNSIIPLVKLEISIVYKLCQKIVFKLFWGHIIIKSKNKLRNNYVLQNMRKNKDTIQVNQTLTKKISYFPLPPKPQKKQQPYKRP
jgi:hypothetical protein